MAMVSICRLRTKRDYDASAIGTNSQFAQLRGVLLLLTVTVKI